MGKNKILIIIIFAVAVFFRFFQLDSNPPSLTWDEASWGINAYSISVSGKDEFGKFLPITYLESFGDFKPPLYAYLTTIPIWIFGLNEFSVRFMSAFLGSLTVLVSYILVKEIFYFSKNRTFISLTTAFLLAISPWHIMLSRAAFEANVATFFIVLGTFMFLFSTKDKKNMVFLTFSLLSFVLAFYTFNTSRVFLPLFVPVLFYLRRRIIFKNLGISIFALTISFIAVLPVLLFMLTPQAQLRFQEVNIFSDISVIERTNQEMENSGNSLISKVIYNRRIAYAVELLSHYMDHFNPLFLFIKGDGNPKFSIQDVGQMYLWELPFLIIGTLLLFKKKEGAWIIIPFWILLGIVPAATARETPHALRIETTLPMFQLLTAYGMTATVFFIKAKIKNSKAKKIIWAGGGFLILLFFIYFIHNYFNHYPVTYASEWQYGYKEAIEFTEKNKDSYDKIYFTRDLGRPYAYIFFYGGYPYDTLVKDADIKREALGFVHIERFDKYYFPSVLPSGSKNSLFVNVPDKVPEGAIVLKTISLPNGSPSLVVYEK